MSFASFFVSGIIVTVLLTAIEVSCQRPPPSPYQGYPPGPYQGYPPQPPQNYQPYGPQHYQANGPYPTPQYPGYPGYGYPPCKSPIAINAPYPLYFNPDLLEGTWYIYRHLLTGSNGYNRIYRVSTISKTVMAGQTTVPAATQRTSISWYPMESSANCSNMEFLGFTSYYGLYIVDVYQEERPITTRTYTTVYHEPRQGLLVLHRCEQPNLAENKCDIPHVDVRVRQRPDEMSEKRKREIDSILDNLFHPYCLSARQIPLCEYTKDKEECPEREPTPDQQRKIEGLRQTKA